MLKKIILAGLMVFAGINTAVYSVTEIKDKAQFDGIIAKEKCVVVKFYSKTCTV